MGRGRQPGQRGRGSEQGGKGPWALTARCRPLVAVSRGPAPQAQPGPRPSCRHPSPSKPGDRLPMSAHPECTAPWGSVALWGAAPLLPVPNSRASPAQQTGRRLHTAQPGVQPGQQPRQGSGVNRLRKRRGPRGLGREESISGGEPKASWESREAGAGEAGRGAAGVRTRPPTWWPAQGPRQRP